VSHPLWSIVVSEMRRLSFLGHRCMWHSGSFERLCRGELKLDEESLPGSVGHAARLRLFESSNAAADFCFLPPQWRSNSLFATADHAQVRRFETAKRTKDYLRHRIPYAPTRRRRQNDEGEIIRGARKRFAIAWERKRRDKEWRMRRIPSFVTFCCRCPVSPPLSFKSSTR